MKPLKRFGKRFLARRLEEQVIALRAAHQIIVVAVAGSVGKTSTKVAIAELLTACGAKVQYQAGNYNDRLTVPLIFFSETEPGIFNISAWLAIIRRAKAAVGQDYPYTHVIVELGTDGPGQMAEFAYLKPEIGVLTAIAAEHLEYFQSLDAVAAEELQLANYARQLLVNVDDVDPKYLPKTAYLKYGTGQAMDYGIKQLADGALLLKLQDRPMIRTAVPYLGVSGSKVALAAAAVADLAGYTSADIAEHIGSLQPVSGRMQLLKGQNGSLIIDDTYNASPLAVTAALQTLSARPETTKIAILGSMNELGADSQAAHQAVGALCDPTKLHLVVTIGKQANDWLAPAAEARGCMVTRCQSPIAAGQTVLPLLTSETIVLVKGSQNGVFAEEAVKVLLADMTHSTKLVRQSPDWMAIKRRQFADITS